MLDRRSLLKGSAASLALGGLPRAALAAAPPPPADAWRRFELVTRVEVKAPPGGAQAWIPLPSVADQDWIRPEDSSWSAESGEAARVRDGASNLEMLHVRWAEGDRRLVEVTSRFSTRDRAVNLAGGGSAAPLSPADRARYLAGTALAPVDGIVERTADGITAGASGDIDRARAIYEWVVTNTFRNPATRGCGEGDVAAMLRTGNLGGKCADINALFVALARAAGLPARDLYGIRVAPSRLGYRSLGPSGEVVTKAQHCRAEVHLAGLGWTPMDPADVRKVMLEEGPTVLPLDDARVAAAHHRLFGAWEGNWLPYNTGSDIVLPGSRSGAVGFLMYPHVETVAGRADCYAPDAVRYEIKARELSL